MLQTTIPNKNWFISGSFASPDIRRPKDIDIFFYSEKDYQEAYDTFYTMQGDKDTLWHNSVNAATFYIGIPTPIQLIKKLFGTPEELFDTFDINICKRAILSGGTSVLDPSCNKDIRVDRVSPGTFSRYFKYLYYLDRQKDIPIKGEELINKFIGDSTVITTYYDEKEEKMATNQALFKACKGFHALKPYLWQEAKKKKHAPELLI